MQRAVADTVTRAIREGLPSSELESLLANKFGKAEAHARTIARTALGAFDRADTVRQAALAGAKRFKYVGPGASRSFCQHHLQNIYGLEEIKRMNNGQGLPVLYYGGGWNCRHTWEPVIAQQRLAPEVVFPNGKRAMRHLAFAQDEADRDDVTRQNFNGNVTLSIDPDVDDILDTMLGRTLSDKEHIRLCGAMDGAEVRIVGYGDEVYYYVKHPSIAGQSERYLTTDNGRIELHNQILKINPSQKGQGLGPRIVATGLVQASLIGVEVVTVQAAGDAGSDWQGYLQWPKMGFDARIPQWAAQNLPTTLQGKIERFTDFLIYPEGLKWWADNGSNVNLEFDLDTDSLSQIVLLEYLKYKGIIL